MAITVKVDTWDDTKWDDSFTPASLIQLSDTFIVSAMDINNRTVSFAPSTTNYTANLVARSWENSSWDDAGSGLGSIVNGQTFTVNLIDYNNRVVWMTG